MSRLVGFSPRRATFAPSRRAWPKSGWPKGSWRSLTSAPSSGIRQAPRQPDEPRPTVSRGNGRGDRHNRTGGRGDYEETDRTADGQGPVVAVVVRQLRPPPGARRLAQDGERDQRAGLPPHGSGRGLPDATVQSGGPVYRQRGGRRRRLEGAGDHPRFGRPLGQPIQEPGQPAAGASAEDDGDFLPGSASVFPQ